MKKVAIVTGPVPQCGIKIYADRLLACLSGSRRYAFSLLTAANKQHFLDNEKAFDCFIYNWHDITLGWLDSSITRKINKPQVQLIGHGPIHNQNLLENIKTYICVDPTFQGNAEPGIRPVIYYKDIKYTPPGSELIVGTSGFGHQGKGILELIRILNKQSEKIIFNIHFSTGAYTGYSTEDKVRELISPAKEIAKPHVELRTYHTFLGDEELIRWLNKNDINILYYPNLPCQGVSASIDAALAAKKPIGVNNSNLFKHIYCDGIDITQKEIREIVSHNLKPLEIFYSLWNAETITKQYERILDSICLT